MASLYMSYKLDIANLFFSAVILARYAISFLHIIPQIYTLILRMTCNNIY